MGIEGVPGSRVLGMMWQLLRYAEIRNVHVGPRDPRERIDRSKLAQKRADHLRRNVCRIRANALRRDAMVSCRNDNCSARVRMRWNGAAHCGEAFGEFFDTAQTAERFGQVVDTVARDAPRFAVSRRNRDVKRHSNSQGVRVRR